MSERQFNKSDVSKATHIDVVENHGGTRDRVFSLRPIICLLTLSACYNTRYSKRKGLILLLWTYQGSFILVLLLYTVRSLVLLATNVLSFITPVLFTCQCVGNCIICWKSFSKKYGQFHKSMELWHRTISKMTQEEMPIDYGYFSKRQRVVAVCVVLLQLMSNSALFVINFVMFSEKELTKIGYNSTYTTPFKDTIGSRILLTIPVCAQMITLITPAFYLIVVSVMLRTGFRAFNKYLEQVCHEGNGLSTTKLEHIRRIHLNLCEVVSKLDQDLYLLYGNIYFWTLGAGIIILYGLVKYSLTIFSIIVLVFYLGLTLGILFAISIFAAYVHEEAHAPLDTVYYINVETISLEKATQLNLFLSKLNGTQVGFTTFGLLTITKEFILTIAGVFLTYFVVLYTTV